MYLLASHRNCGEREPPESCAEWIALSIISRLDCCIFPPSCRPKLHLIISFTRYFIEGLAKLSWEKGFLDDVRN